MEEYKGLVKIDSFWIPADEVDQYKIDRETCAEELMKEFKRICYTVDREFAGSEEGEAITGYDKNDDLMCLVHLDPYTIPILMDEIQKKTLFEYILEINDLNEDGSPKYEKETIKH